jgi:hypothetical protein
MSSVPLSLCVKEANEILVVVAGKSFAVTKKAVMEKFSLKYSYVRNVYLYSREEEGGRTYVGEHEGCEFTWEHVFPNSASLNLIIREVK